MRTRDGERGMGGGGGGAIILGRRLIEGRLLFEAVHMNCDVDSHFQNKIVYASGS